MRNPTIALSSATAFTIIFNLLKDQFLEAELVCT